MHLCVSSFGCSTDSRSTERAKSISELRLADFRQKWQVRRILRAGQVKLRIAGEVGDRDLVNSVPLALVLHSLCKLRIRFNL